MNNGGSKRKTPRWVEESVGGMPVISLALEKL
jgi:hypothetical protein